MPSCCGRHGRPLSDALEAAAPADAAIRPLRLDDPREVENFLALQRAATTVEAEHAEWRTLRVTTGARNAPAIRLYRKLGFVEAGTFEPEPGVLLLCPQKARAE